MVWSDLVKWYCKIFCSVPLAIRSMHSLFHIAQFFFLRRSKNGPIELHWCVLRRLVKLMLTKVLCFAFAPVPTFMRETCESVELTHNEPDYHTKMACMDLILILPGFRKWT